MKFSGLAARRAAAFGASAAVLATLTAGLVAGPAQAATAGKTGVKVSATAPKAKPGTYEGDCPVKVNFSAKIKVSVKGKTELAYRWLHGDGSKSKVSVVKLKGKGTKTVTVRQSVTFKEDVKGWEAIQVLSPKKYVTKKGYFSVSCAQPEREPKVDIHLPGTPSVSASAWANPDSYVGVCSPGNKIGFTGLIKANRPTWVKYRWVLNGDVVDYGKVKVRHAAKVGFGFSPRESHRGWAQLQILGPDRAWSNRASYSVWCKDPAPAPVSKVAVSGLVTATNHDGCKLGAHATVSTTGSAKVSWTWRVNGVSVSSGESFFRGSESRTVTLPESALIGEATKGGKVSLTVSGPHNTESIFQSYAACKVVTTQAPATDAPAPSTAA
ncbi:hypothetical protein Nocox_37420 [Nonomuraea coxensis DSM 45129]|uniref:Ig-like domain-containing protein n=1 Tax=Nonomuraea coxensis DSM 45129 TaxID=1122611 RepID=A0ABX8UBI7_9ACTN|nr:hypothetical protein [Nonomuraea coxensis]QYC45037.1 hypothetical protein Nocox_37420 [Nonomuraea coxensis DSM 45129]